MGKNWYLVGKFLITSLHEICLAPAPGGICIPNFQHRMFTSYLKRHFPVMTSGRNGLGTWLIVCTFGFGTNIIFSKKRDFDILALASFSLSAKVPRLLALA